MWRYESSANLMPSLKTDIAVSALIRRATSAGAFAAIIRKGDEDAGVYLVVTRHVDKANENKAGAVYTLYRPIRNVDGERIWWPKPSLTQAELDIYINRRIDEDPDIWVVEIDDTQGRHFLIEPIESEASLGTALQEDNLRDLNSDMALKAAIKAAFRDP